MDTDQLLLESAVNKATELVAGVLKIKRMDSNKRLALKAALRYLKQANQSDGAPKKTFVQ
jgi:hypothetical protein